MCNVFAPNDNVVVNSVKLGGEFMMVTDSPTALNFDPFSLEMTGKHKWSDHIVKFGNVSTHLVTPTRPQPAIPNLRWASWGQDTHSASLVGMAGWWTSLSRRPSSARAMVKTPFFLWYCRNDAPVVHNI